jgi:hypothetical protein
VRISHRRPVLKRRPPDAQHTYAPNLPRRASARRGLECSSRLSSPHSGSIAVFKPFEPDSKILFLGSKMSSAPETHSRGWPGQGRYLLAGAGNCAFSCPLRAFEAAIHVMKPVLEAPPRSFAPSSSPPRRRYLYPSNSSGLTAAPFLGSKIEGRAEDVRLVASLVAQWPPVPHRKDFPPYAGPLGLQDGVSVPSEILGGHRN